ncbi:DegT/DnrJ/EryC1/StrS family aminotransferase [Candidatus Auribacterota bacterium]
MKVALCNLKKQYLPLKKEIDTAIAKIINSTSFILGKEVENFERHLEKYLDIKYGVGCASGTDAIILALRALGIQPGDEVITTPFTFISTASSITRIGAKPLFVDIDPQTFNIDPIQIEKRITKKTKAIIVVHLFGQACRMSEVLKIAKRYKLKVIEDNAQSLGSRYKGKLTATMGDIGTLSFFPAKTLGGFGDGGAVVTNKKKLAENLKCLRLHGTSKQYYYQEIGYNSRLDTLQAAVLNIKLKYLNKFNALRREKAEQYNRLLEGIAEVKIPYAYKDNYHIYGQYVVTIKQRDQLKQYLTKQGIASAIYYPYPLHLQPCYKDLNYQKGALKVTEASCKKVLALPFYPEISLKEQKQVVSAIKSFYSS